MLISIIHVSIANYMRLGDKYPAPATRDIHNLVTDYRIKLLIKSFYTPLPRYSNFTIDSAKEHVLSQEILRLRHLRSDRSYLSGVTSPLLVIIPLSLLLVTSEIQNSCHALLFNFWVIELTSLYPNHA